MSEQPPPDDDSHGSHSRPEAGDGPVGSTQSDIVAPKAPEYSVGYGRAPLHSRFKPGQSGNAKGRPKDSRNVKTELKKFTPTTRSVLRGSSNVAFGGKTAWPLAPCIAESISICSAT